MKHFISKFIPVAFVVALLFSTSCSDDNNDDAPDLTPTPSIYSLVLNLTLSDAFLDSSIGTFTVTYKDADGVEEEVVITSSPYSLTLEGFEDGDEYEFEFDCDLAQGYVAPEESKTFAFGYDLIGTNDNGGMAVYKSSSSSLTVSADNIEAYVESFSRSVSGTF
ncbi:MAG: hypothetical protein SNH55_04905 [Rikenellaceae bacterium]